MKNNNYAGDICRNEPLAKYTTWRVGGLAKVMYKPKGIVDLANYLKTIHTDEPILWLGLGSNFLIKDIKKHIN